MERALVLDQATVKTGFAVVDFDPGCPVSFGVDGRLIAHGLITAPVNAGLLDRLHIIRADLKSLVATYKPTELVIENTLFYTQKSGQTNNAMSAIFYLCQDVAKEAGIAFYSQYPQTIKAHVCGNGNASKEEVKQGVCIVWGLNPRKIRDDNHADALAGAYVWLFRAEEVRAEALAKKGKKKRAKS